MNTDALLPITEPMLYENYHALSARNTFLISCNLCFWQSITEETHLYIHLGGHPSYLKKKKQTTNKPTHSPTVEGTRFQAVYC